MYALYSLDRDRIFEWFDHGMNASMKNFIRQYLVENPADTVEILREYAKADFRRSYGYELMGTYAINPKTKLPSKVYYQKPKEKYIKL